MNEMGKKHSWCHQSTWNLQRVSGRRQKVWHCFQNEGDHSCVTLWRSNMKSVWRTESCFEEQHSERRICKVAPQWHAWLLSLSWYLCVWTSMSAPASIQISRCQQHNPFHSSSVTSQLPTPNIVCFSFSQPTHIRNCIKSIFKVTLWKRLYSALHNSQGLLFISLLMTSRVAGWSLRGQISILKRICKAAEKML